MANTDERGVTRMVEDSFAKLIDRVCGCTSPQQRSARVQNFLHDFQCWPVSAARVAAVTNPVPRRRSEVDTGLDRRACGFTSGQSAAIGRHHQPRLPGRNPTHPQSRLRCDRTSDAGVQLPRQVGATDVEWRLPVRAIGGRNTAGSRARSQAHLWPAIACGRV